jgi:hypothetical protein
MFAGKGAWPDTEARRPKQADSILAGTISFPNRHKDRKRRGTDFCKTERTIQK